MVKKILYPCEWTVAMGDLGEGPERKEKTWAGEGAETAEEQLTK